MAQKWNYGSLCAWQAVIKANYPCQGGSSVVPLQGEYLVLVIQTDPSTDMNPEDIKKGTSLQESGFVEIPLVRGWLPDTYSFCRTNYGYDSCDNDGEEHHPSPSYHPYHAILTAKTKFALGAMSWETRLESRSETKSTAPKMWIAPAQNDCPTKAKSPECYDLKCDTIVYYGTTNCIALNWYAKNGVMIQAFGDMGSQWLFFNR